MIVEGNMRNLFCMAFVIILTGCTAPLSVNKLKNFTPTSKIFVLTNNSPWDAKLRVSLNKYGFKVLKFSSQEQVVSTSKGGQTKVIYNNASARYAITFTWSVVDRCIYNSSLLVDGTLEVSDIRTNEVLMSIEKGGWTGPCADPRGMVFDGLSEALSQNWK